MRTPVGACHRVPGPHDIGRPVACLAGSPTTTVWPAAHSRSPQSSVGRADTSSRRRTLAPWAGQAARVRKQPAGFQKRKPPSAYLILKRERGRHRLCRNAFSGPRQPLQEANRGPPRTPSRRVGWPSAGLQTAVGHTRTQTVTVTVYGKGLRKKCLERLRKGR